jgi:putative ATP-dependent endonuclease of OLD family
MMGVLVKEVRVSGFRGLDNFSIDLEPITVLTGMNNVGKTSLLKAIQLAFGGRHLITMDDFHINDVGTRDKIIVETIGVRTKLN